MHLPQNAGGGDFTPPPAGTHMAVCYRVIDLGTQLVEFQGERKHQRKVMLSWELCDEHMEDGQPYSIHKRYTLSSHERSTLRQDLEAWRGARFQDSDFGPGGFDIKKLLGVGCMLTVVHANKDGKTYANIGSVVKPPKGMKAQAPINPMVYFSLDQFDSGVFNTLSQGLQEVIRKSPEYAAATSGKSAGFAADEPPPHVAEDMNDDIPF